MYRKEVNEKSPLRILEQSIHGGLGKGNLGVVMARAGVGKTACLVQIGLDDLMRDRNVLHISLGGETVHDVRGWYDALFADMAHVTGLDDREAVHGAVDHHRIIQAYPESAISAEKLEYAVDLFANHAGFQPTAILVDGYDWECPDATAEALVALRACAERHGAELWMTAQTHREETGPHPTDIPPPCAPHAAVIDVVLLLEPQSNHVTIRLLKDHDHDAVDDTHLELQPDTMRVVVADDLAAGGGLPPVARTLLSGGARGAESAFGECAERWGLSEVNFSYEGRIDPARRRGQVVLTTRELRQGAVSERYLEAHMHRTYKKTPAFDRLLKSIWHQVNTSHAVYVVGRVLEDGTVKGGTGWAAELAKHLEKPLCVFDQEQDGWFTWTGRRFAPADPPRIQSRRFTGTGTRALTEAGRAAIEGLFERSFGPPPER